MLSIVAVRKHLRSRLKDLGIGRLYLPQLTFKKPEEPHIPVAATPAKYLRAKRRVVVLVNDEFQDLGVFAWRMLARDAGIKSGSFIAFIEELMARSQVQHRNSHIAGSSLVADESNNTVGAVNTSTSAAPGFIALNPGQLLYSYALNESMSRNTWNARNVPSAAHQPICVRAQNYVEGNKTPEEHVAFVFSNIISDTRFVHQDAELYIVGMQDRGDLVLRYLDSHWSSWHKRVKAVALMESRHIASSISNSDFKTFLKERARAWSLSTASPGAVLASPNINSKSADLTDNMELPAASSNHINWCENLPKNSSQEQVSQSSRAGAAPTDTTMASVSPITEHIDTDASTQPVYSAGDLTWAECIFPNVYKTVVDWFEDVAHAPESYKNQTIFESELWRGEEPGLGDGDQQLEEDRDRQCDGEVNEQHNEDLAQQHQEDENLLHQESEGQRSAHEETAANTDRDAFVGNQVDEPVVTVGGVQLPASLLSGAGLGVEEENTE